MATLKVEIPENSQNILGTAIIKAPLEKVFKAHTDEDLFRKWWGSGIDNKVYAFDARSGGEWRMSNGSSDGTRYEFGGSFHEVAKNERIIWTFEFLNMPERGHVALEKITFRAVDDYTTEIYTVSTYQSVEDRDAMVATGMEEGWKESLEGLEKVASYKQNKE